MLWIHWFKFFNPRETICSWQARPFLLPFIVSHATCLSVVGEWMLYGKILKRVCASGFPLCLSDPSRGTFTKVWWIKLQPQDGHTWIRASSASRMDLKTHHLGNLPSPWPNCEQEQKCLLQHVRNKIGLIVIYTITINLTVTQLTS